MKKYFQRLLILMRTGFQLVVISCLGHSFTLAADYRSDLRGLQTALSQSRFKSEDLAQYENPFVGRATYILPESRAPWAGNYFSMEQGGIANRWQVPGYPQQHETLPDAKEIAQWSLDKIDKLSPAEKYDLFVGDYNYSVTRHELSFRGPYRSQPPAYWEGFCNGVRCAGYSLNEPQQAIDVINPDGITIRFQPSDLKALAGASYFYADKYADMGRPSRGEEIAGGPPNAAAFDLALRYYLAVKRKAFVVDTNLGPEIWNESVIGFERRLSPLQELSQDERLRYPKAIQKVFVETTLYTLGEVGIQESNGPTKKQVAKGQLHGTTPVSYTLYLESGGKAIDGSWGESADLRGVDFAWFSSGRGMDSAYSPTSKEAWRVGTGNANLAFKVLKQLFKKSMGPTQCRKIF